MLKHWPKLWIARIALAAIAITALCAAANPPAAGVAALQAQLSAARARALSNFARIASQTGFADQIVARLDSDQAEVTQADRSDAAEMERLDVRVALDTNLVDQLISTKALQAFQQAGSAGLDLVGSSSDKTLQPLAIYLPPSYAFEKSAPLIVMLHGLQQTETELLSQPVLRKLADASGVVIVAPWLRGDSPVNSLSTSDLADALAFAQANYRIDRRHTYLGGVSMGAFNAFAFAPSNSQAWAAVLSVAGSLRNDDKDAYVRAMQMKPAFLVIGSDDPLVNAQYVQGTVSYLNSSGVEAHYYEQRGGVHSLDSLEPALARAWNDMLAGVQMHVKEIQSPSPVGSPTVHP